MARGAHRVKLSELAAHAAARRVARGALQSNGAARLYGGGGVLARSAAARHARAGMPIGQRLRGLNLSAPDSGGLILPSSGVMAPSANAPAPLQPNMASGQPQDQSQGTSRIVRPAPQTMTQGQRDYFAYVDRVAAEAHANANARAQEELQRQLAQHSASGLPANIATSAEPLRHGNIEAPLDEDDGYRPTNVQWRDDLWQKPQKADFTYHPHESSGGGTVYPNQPSDETSPTVPTSTVPLEDGDGVTNTGGGGGGGGVVPDEDEDDTTTKVIKHAAKKTWSQQTWGERLHNMLDVGEESVGYREAAKGLDDLWGTGAAAGEAGAAEVGTGARLMQGAARLNPESWLVGAVYAAGEYYRSQHPDPNAPDVTSPDDVDADQ